MFQKAQPLFLTCETPLHAGSGDALGVVDLPIQRERHTSFPKIEASSLKGALREAFEELLGRKNSDIIKAFGPEEGDAHAGALGFTDARLLLFPIKSMKGVFAWITCPKALRQFESDMTMLKSNSLTVAISGDVAEGHYAAIGTKPTVEINTNKVVLEEYTFSKQQNDPLSITVDGRGFSAWIADNLFENMTYWQGKAQNDILVLSDNDFKDFVNLSTEVITRIKIDEKTGTVQRGALFTEEYLPAESVLYALALASPEFLNAEQIKKRETRPETADTVMKTLTDGIAKLPVIQLGGNATLGKGLLRTKLIASPSKIDSNE